jgi:hypothetical protein
MTIATIKKEIKDLKNALNTKLDEKYKVKLREQLSKSEKTLAEMESAKTPTAKKTATKKSNVVAKKSTSVLKKIKQAQKSEPKKSTAKQPSVLQKIKSQIKLNKNLSGYKKSGIDLVRDADRPALPAGKRISKDGNVYYENRLNRVDVKQPPKRYPKLEMGGELTSFEQQVKDALKQENKWHFINEMVDGQNVQLKMFPSKTSVDVQIFKIDGIHARMPKNYVGKRETIKMIMDNFTKMADGGMMAKGVSNEMHRAYAMGGVLQHGLENGDFIVSHDEGKMIIMNGGNKYEVNIHSGSRTKID